MQMFAYSRQKQTWLLCHEQVNVEHWLLVVTSRDHSRALDFCKMYSQCARSMGIMVAQPAMMSVPNDRTETYLQAIRSRLSPQVRSLLFACTDCSEVVMA